MTCKDVPNFQYEIISWPNIVLGLRETMNSIIIAHSQKLWLFIIITILISLWTKTYEELKPFHRQITKSRIIKMCCWIFVPWPKASQIEHCSRALVNILEIIDWCIYHQPYNLNFEQSEDFLPQLCYYLTSDKLTVSI